MSITNLLVMGTIMRVFNLAFVAYGTACKTGFQFKRKQFFGSKRLEQASCSVEKISALALRKRFDSWTAPIGLASVQIFSVHIKDFLDGLYNDAVIFEKNRPITRLQWSEK